MPEASKIALVPTSSLTRRPAKKSPKRPQDWHWQIRNAVTSLPGLDAALTLTDSERRGAMRAADAGLPMSITPYYLSLCDPHDPTCPVRMQCVPDIREGDEVVGDLKRPTGRGGARGRAPSRAAVSRSRAAPRDRPLRCLLPLLHAVTHGRRWWRRGLARSARARARVSARAPRSART